MSEHNDSNPVSPRGILGGFLLAGLIGAVLGVLASAASWPRPATLESSGAIFAWMVFAGVCVGGGTGLVVGLILAWHAAGIAANPNSPSAAPVWGGFTGLVLGASFGPVAGLVFGVAVQQIVGGLVLGVLLGPLLGVLSWQTAYWLPQLLKRA